MATHADVANSLVATLPPGAFGRAALPAATHQDFTMLEHMLPGVRFTIHKVADNMWELSGTCADGSTVVWQLGE